MAMFLFKQAVTKVKKTNFVLSFLAELLTHTCVSDGYFNFLKTLNWFLFKYTIFTHKLNRS